MLTHRQHQLVTYIAEETRRRGGVTPTHREIADATGLKSAGAVTNMIRRCVERGALRHLSRKARAVEVIRLMPIEQWFLFDA